MRYRPKFYIWFIICALAIGMLLPLNVSAQCTGVCGDVNASGGATMADVMEIYHWLWLGTIPAGELECAELDHYQDVTIRDPYELMVCIFKCTSPKSSLDCSVRYPPMVPTATDAISMYYSNIFPAGDSVVTISLRLHTEEGISAMTIPLHVSLNGTIPEIEVIRTDPNDVWDYDTSSTIPPVAGAGDVMLGYWDFNPDGHVNDDPIAWLRITAPPLPENRAILLEFTNLPPSDNGAMILVGEPLYYDPLIPNLFPCNVELFGDADGSGGVSASDIILTVQWIFKQQAGSPVPCEAAADANCTGQVTAADVIYLVNHVFKSGPVPCNVCELVGNGTWSCP